MMHDNSTGLWTSRRSLFRSPGVVTTVFLHIPKTGGTSLVSCLRQNALGRWRVRLNGPSDLHLLDAITPRRWRDVGLIEGHVSWDVLEQIPPPRHVVTMLRDPIERVLSFYSYVRGKEDHHLREFHAGIVPPLREFLTLESSSEADNWMVRQIAGGDGPGAPVGGVTEAMFARAIEHLDSCVAIGVMERFDRSLAAIGAALGWKRWSSPRLNVTPDRVRRDTLDDATMDLLRERTELDRRLYAHAMERLDRSRS
jgi:hypothetical protein